MHRITTASTEQTMLRTYTDHSGATSSSSPPSSGPIRAPTRMVPPSAVMARPTCHGSTRSATNACRARLHTLTAGARRKVPAMNSASAPGPPHTSAATAKAVNSPVTAVASTRERASPSRSITMPAGTVVASEMAPMMATMSAASGAEAPSCMAAITETGTVAPLAVPSSVDGTSTGHSSLRYSDSGRPDACLLVIDASKVSRHRDTSTAVGPGP